MGSRWLRRCLAGMVFGLLTWCPFLVQPVSAQGATTLDSVLVVPNPYTVSGRTAGKISDLKGYDQIAFVNLPAPCTIRIYTIGGNFVHELKNEPGDGDGDKVALWNGRNIDNQYIVSDIYVYIVNAPAAIVNGQPTNLGVKLLKLVVIR